jgi:hypothetical protein
VFGEVALDQVSHERRRAGLGAFTQRVAALIDLTLEALGFLARCRHRPVGPSADGEPALAAVNAVREHERACAGGGDAYAEADDTLIVDDDVLRTGL